MDFVGNRNCKYAGCRNLHSKLQAVCVPCTRPGRPGPQSLAGEMAPAVATCLMQQPILLQQATFCSNLTASKARAAVPDPMLPVFPEHTLWPPLCTISSSPASEATGTLLWLAKEAQQCSQLIPAGLPQQRSLSLWGRFPAAVLQFASCFSLCLPECFGYGPHCAENEHSICMAKLAQSEEWWVKRGLLIHQQIPAPK